MQFHGVIGGFLLLFPDEVDIECLSVGVGCIDCVSQVHEEQVAQPTEPVFDVRIGELCSVQLIGYRDPN